MDVIIVGVVLPWIVVGLGCWLVFQLIQQNGRILLHLERLEQRLGQLAGGPQPMPGDAPPMPAGLPLGSPAPEFELPDLTGGRTSLAQFRGKRVLVVFFNPGCGFCTMLAPDLAGLPVDGADGRPVPVVVSTGDPEETRKLVEEHNLRCPVLLQQGMEVASQYQANGTPMGYLIDEEGCIASEMGVGGPALMSIAQNADAALSLNGNVQKAHRGNRSLADSRIARDGLAAGTPAPNFTLPRLDGGELSLEEFRGRRVVLVFSDPHCGPCDHVAPLLEQEHRRGGDLQVVMVSRGDEEENRAKVKEHGLTFPVALQRQWEISKRYAMFATPIAYLIDEAGVIAADVAVGEQAILALFQPQSAPCPCGRPAGECPCGKKNGRAVEKQRAG